MQISANSCTVRQRDRQTDTQMDKSTNLIISSNSLRSIGGDKYSSMHVQMQTQHISYCIVMVFFVT